MLGKCDLTHSLDTDLIHAGAYCDTELTRYPESMPIYMTTVFNVTDLDDAYHMIEDKGFIYNRTSNPNRTALGKIVSRLEGGEDTLVCSSGMAAISTALLSTLSAGDHILSDHTLYGETFDLFNLLFSRYGVENTCIDINDMEQVRANIRPNTKVIYTESASNPTIMVPDVDALSNAAHENGALLFVDNTFMTAYGFRPLEHGADVVINSLTKFMGGHCDALCGAITGSAVFIQNCTAHQWVLGCGADAMTSYMVQRGLRTMALRMEKAYANAKILAERLESHPCVTKVLHPSLKSHPQHELAKRMFQGRYGAMLSFDVINGTYDHLNAFLRKLEIIHYAASLGGIRTTISVPRHSSHRRMDPQLRLASGITDSLIRVSVGCEDIEDIWRDFDQALTVFQKEAL